MPTSNEILSELESIYGNVGGLDGDRAIWLPVFEQITAGYCDAEWFICCLQLVCIPQLMSSQSSKPLEALRTIVYSYGPAGKRSMIGRRGPFRYPKPYVETPLVSPLNSELLVPGQDYPFWTINPSVDSVYVRGESVKIRGPETGVCSLNRMRIIELARSLSRTVLSRIADAGRISEHVTRRAKMRQIVVDITEWESPKPGESPSASKLWTAVAKRLSTMDSSPIEFTRINSGWGSFPNAGAE